MDQITKEEINSMISRLNENPVAFMITALKLSQMQICEIDKELSEKQRWYILTADEVKNNPDKLSIEEKEEFLNIHLKLVELFKRNNI